MKLKTGGIFHQLGKFGTSTLGCLLDVNERLLGLQLGKNKLAENYLFFHLVYHRSITSVGLLNCWWPVRGRRSAAAHHNCTKNWLTPAVQQG